MSEVVAEGSNVMAWKRPFVSSAPSERAEGGSPGLKALEEAIYSCPLSALFKVKERGPTTFFGRASASMSPPAHPLPYPPRGDGDD